VKWVRVLGMQVTLHDRRIVMQVTLHYEVLVMQVTLHDKIIVMQVTLHYEVLVMQVTLHDKIIVMQVTLHYEAIVMRVTLHDKRIVIQVTLHYEVIVMQLRCMVVILIDKIEENKSINKSDIQKNLYNALVESYNSDKDIITSYGDVVTLKRGRDDQDKDEDPSVGSNRGSKRRRSGKEAKLSKEPTHKVSKSTSSSKGASRSQLTSSGKSAYAVEHGQKDDDLEDRIHQEFNTANDDVTHVREALDDDENEMNKNRLMRTDELHKFSDGILNHVRTALNDIATWIEMDYLPKRKWSKQDKQRARVMINAIDKKLRDRRLMRNVEKFVGGRPYGGDLRLLERTI
nr:hypothetical protein [Tanacetum cinerariifolium]